MKFKRPVDPQYPVTGEYGQWGNMWNHHINTIGLWVRATREDGMGQHKGVDFGCPIGTEVFAMADGLVDRAGWENPGNYKQGFGLRVRQQIRNDEGGGETLVYAHLSAMTVHDGQQVVKGDRIGYSGNSGRTTGPHLHVERVDGRGQYYPLEFEEAELPPIVVQAPAEAPPEPPPSEAPPETA